MDLAEEASLVYYFLTPWFTWQTFNNLVELGVKGAVNLLIMEKGKLSCTFLHQTCIVEV